MRNPGDAEPRSERELPAFVLCGAFLLTFAAPAHAGGFHSPYQSSTAIGAAFAGASVRADDASFFLTNPATISGLQGGRQSFIDARGFLPSVGIDPSRATSAIGADVTRDGSSGSFVGGAMAAGSATVIPLGKGLAFGFGTAVPFGADIETRRVWAGRYHLLGTKMIGANATGAVSWQATPWLAIAGGAQVQRFTARFENTALIPLGGPPIEAHAYMTGESWTLGGVAGVVLTPFEGTRVGASWRQGLTHRMRGEAGTSLVGIVPMERVRFDMKLPQVATVGLEQRLAQGVRLLAELQWVDWTRFGGFDVSFDSGRPNELRPISWRDTWMGSVGVGVKVAAATEITAGLGYDMGASKGGQGNTLSPDGNKWILGAGAIHDLGSAGRITVGYGHVIVEKAPVVARSVQNGTLEGSLAGHMHVLGAGWSFSW